MIRALVFSILFFTVFSCSCVCQNSSFNYFKDKFPLKELPLNIPKDCKDRSANDPSNITNEEIVKFLEIDTTIWKFTEEYYYNTACRFFISPIYDALIYYRSYLPFNFSKQKSESILVVFNDNGQLLDELVIQGSIGDNLTFESTISEDNRITISYENLVLNDEGDTHIISTVRNYKINAEGKINLMELK